MKTGTEVDKPYLVRVDDFPAWEETMDRFVPVSDYAAFHAILAAHGIPYMIAATPQPALCPLDPKDDRTRQLSGDECAILQRIAKEGASIGLHGVTHRTRRDRPHSEFIDLDDGFFQEMIRYGDIELKRQTGIRAEVFVPPFNRISSAQLKILARRFPVVCGGPESTPTIGRVEAYALPGNSKYIPSYPPYYGRAHEIQAALNNATPDRQICLTLHWEWERRRGYGELERLCRALQGQVMGWEALFNDTAA